MKRHSLSDYPTPDMATVDRLLAAVANPPENIDRKRLLSDLGSMQTSYYFGKGFRTNPAKWRKDRAGRLSAAKRLLDLVAPWEPIYHEVKRFIAALERAGPKEFDPEHGLIDGMSLLEWFVGIRLAICFEHHFRAKPSVTQVAGTNIFKGDFLDFAEAAIDELGVTNNGHPYARGTIAAALWKIRKFYPDPMVLMREFCVDIDN